MNWNQRKPWVRKGIPLAGALLLLEACGLNSIQKPSLFGPSELALSLNMTVTPSIVTADDHSQVNITVTARDRNGQPAVGVALDFAEFEDTSIVSLGLLVAQVAVTDGNGQAHNIFIAPARTDVNASIKLQIGVRADQGDATQQVLQYKTVTIEIRPPEPSQFPQVGGATAPNCGFIFEPATGGSFPGGQILFQDTSSDTNTGGKIVRYEWNFGDGTPEEEGPPDVNHAFSGSGPFTVLHIVTDNFGQANGCTHSVSP